MTCFSFRPLLCLALFALLTSSVCAQWKSEGFLNIPEYNYSFLASTPDGNLLAATFNSMPSGSPPRDMPALLIRQPASPNPEVIELTRTTFEAQRGYGGIACDSSGNFYVSGDTGDPETCFLRKFRSDGSPETAFGNRGMVQPGKRALGVEVLGQYVFLAVDWGEVYIYDRNTGQRLGTVPRAPGTVFVRDIAIDPKSMRIFGVAKGSVVTWGRGAPWNPNAYDFMPLTPAYGELRAGEGLSIDPIRRTVLISPIPGNQLLEIHGNGQVDRTTVRSAAPDTHIADSVLSFDGTTLYLSDILARRIHVIRRPPPETTSWQRPSNRQNQAPTTSAAQDAPALTWHRSYIDVVRRAREQSRPMVVYFGRQDVPKCQEVQKQILLTDEFNRRAQGFVCVYEDVEKDQLIAHRFGAYRVPFIAILDRDGNTAAEFVYHIDANSLLGAIDSLR